MDVQIDDILQLRRLNFKWTKIASILNISRFTLYRRLEEAGISQKDYTELSDQQLDEVIQLIKRDHPNDGEVLLQALMSSVAYKCLVVPVFPIRILALCNAIPSRVWRIPEVWDPPCK